MGSIGEFEKARSTALGNFDRQLEYEEVLTVTKAGSGALNAIKIFCGTTNPVLGSTIGQVNQVLLLPPSIHLSERVMRTLNRETSPREQVNMIPEKMLLALSKELSDLWMIADSLSTWVRRNRSEDH